MGISGGPVVSTVFTAENLGLIPDRGTKILQAAWPKINKLPAPPPRMPLERP